MRTIDRDDLTAALDAGALQLVSALGPQRFTAVHIPGSVTFPDHHTALDNLDPEVATVVYGTNANDPSSRWAYRVLTSNGFRDVRCYVGGLEDWTGAGLPVSGSGRLRAAGTAT